MVAVCKGAARRRLVAARLRVAGAFIAVAFYVFAFVQSSIIAFSKGIARRRQVAASGLVAGIVGAIALNCGTFVQSKMIASIKGIARRLFFAAVRFSAGIFIADAQLGAEDQNRLIALKGTHARRRSVAAKLFIAGGRITGTRALLIVQTGMFATAPHSSSSARRLFIAASIFIAGVFIAVARYPRASGQSWMAANLSETFS